MTKAILMDDEDKDLAAAYQKARKAAHRQADKTKVNQVVINDEIDLYRVLPDGEQGEARVLYTARPGTVTYMEYCSECDARGISRMSKSDWVAAGRLSVTDMHVKTFGAERAAEIDSKGKNRIPKAAKQIAISEKGSDQMPSRGSTRRVWEIADSLVVDGVSAPRAAIIEACLAAEINRGTAATQYSAWLKARREGK